MKRISVLQIFRTRQRNGFSLVEMIISLSLGGLVVLAIAHSIVGDLTNSSKVLKSFQVTSSQKLVLDLVESDLSYGALIDYSSPEFGQSGCPLTGRKPILSIQAESGVITYTVGSAPSKIWNGDVLMRCGPAYGLDGRLSHSNQFQNRVLLDNVSCESGECLRLEPTGLDGISKIILTQDLFSGSHGSWAVKTDRYVDTALAL